MKKNPNRLEISEEAFKKLNTDIVNLILERDAQAVKIESMKMQIDLLLSTVERQSARLRAMQQAAAIGDTVYKRQQDYIEELREKVRQCVRLGFKIQRAHNISLAANIHIDELTSETNRIRRSLNK